MATIITALNEHIIRKPTFTDVFEYVDELFTDNRLIVVSGEGFALFGARYQLHNAPGDIALVGRVNENDESGSKLEVNIPLAIDDYFIIRDRESGIAYAFNRISEVESEINPLKDTTVGKVLNELATATSEWINNQYPDLVQQVNDSRLALATQAGEENENTDTPDEVEKVEAEIVK